MNLGDILKTVGSGLIQTLLPGTGSVIVAGINHFLDDDNQLPENATGEQAQLAIDSLPPEQRASVLNKEYDVKIEQIKQSYSALNTMLEANSKSTHTTRPKIAYQAFQVIAFSTIAVIASWCFAVVSANVDMIEKIESSWLFVLGVITPLVTVLHAYFGVLRDETKDRFNAAQGHKVDPVSGLIKKLFK
ncbi:MAG: hypothetical protein MJK15_03880 [Colwellia sp.]|nr:hypothetical protein [Colwellia sp.]